MDENCEFTDYINIGEYRNDALLKLLLDKGIITKDEFNKTLTEQSLKRQQLEDVDIEKIKKLTELAKLI